MDDKTKIQWPKSLVHELSSAESSHQRHRCYLFPTLKHPDSSLNNYNLLDKTDTTLAQVWRSFIYASSLISNELYNLTSSLHNNFFLIVQTVLVGYCSSASCWKTHILDFSHWKESSLIKWDCGPFDDCPGTFCNVIEGPLLPEVVEDCQQQVDDDRQGGGRPHHQVAQKVDLSLVSTQTASNYTNPHH